MAADDQLEVQPTVLSQIDRNSIADESLGGPRYIPQAGGGVDKTPEAAAPVGEYRLLGSGGKFPERRPVEVWPTRPELTDGSEDTPQQSTSSFDVKSQMVQNATSPQLPQGTQQTFTPMEGKDGELIDEADYAIQQQEKVTASNYDAAQMKLQALEEAMAGEKAEYGVVPPALAAKYEAAQAEFAEAQAAMKGRVSKLASGSSASAVKAKAAIQDLDNVDPRTMAQAVTKDIPEGALVSKNLEELLSGLETDEIPAWAKPAVAAAEARLSQAGLSVSSVGKNAMYNAIIQSALPIAQQDAQSKLSVFQQNLSNEQQTALANSQFFQNLTMKNLDNRQQAAIVNATNATNANIATAQNRTQASIANAQAFLQMDIANLNNAQQANMITAQMRQQSMLSNQAAENTAKQFNAANEQQANQFNSNLAASIAQFNATQVNQAGQFNANAENAMTQFNSQIGFQRDQFNAQNATAIAQSNAQWRRQMNQINTAGVNAVNQANAMNQFNLSNQALTFLWQELRDGARWANDNAQNEEERRTRMAIAALSNESMSDSNTLNNIKSLAGAAASIFDSWNNGGG